MPLNFPIPESTGGMTNLQIADEYSERGAVADKQALRLRRFFMAVATYAACGVFAQICAWLGYLPSWLPAWWLLGAVAINAVFFIALRRGWNLRLNDPSMTEAQLIASMFAVMILIYHTDVARGVFLMLFPLPLLFGVLRLRLRQLARVGALGIGGYVAVIALLAINEPERVRLGIDFLNLLALLAVMGFVALMGAYISRVREDLSRSVSTIREMAQHDPLTGVFNRRHLMETLAREVVRCERHVSKGLVLCMIDLDHFKRINDTFGHPVGDEVLVAVGRCIGESLRVIDYLARYGGEEFVVLLEGTPGERTMVVCERIRTRVAQLRLPVLQELTITVSIGVAGHEAGESLASLLGRADRALYRAKAEGRNCVRTASLVGLSATASGFSRELGPP